MFCVSSFDTKAFDGVDYEDRYKTFIPTKDHHFLTF